MFYTGWLDEPDELAELDANRSKRLQKILKFERMFLDEWGIHEKKWWVIPSSEKGDMIKTSLSAPNLNMPL